MRNVNGLFFDWWLLFKPLKCFETGQEVVNIVFEIYPFVLSARHCLVLAVKDCRIVENMKKARQELFLT